jgi:hypothetical protein
MIQFQGFAKQTIDILHENRQEYPEIFIHSFSAGACIWGVCQRMMDRSSSKYVEVPQRVIGQVWDSVTHYSRALEAIPIGTFPNSIVLQSIFAGSLWAFLKLQRVTMKNFVSGIANFKANKVSSPALFIGSEIDTIATPEFSMDCIQTWRARGTDVTYKLFNDSQHVLHYRKYPKEYMEAVEELWRKVKLLEKK